MSHEISISFFPLSKIQVAVDEKPSFEVAGIGLQARYRIWAPLLLIFLFLIDPNSEGHLRMETFGGVSWH